MTADKRGQDVSPEFKALVDKTLAPIEELIEQMWERLDEIASRNGRSAT